MQKKVRKNFVIRKFRYNCFLKKLLEIKFWGNIDLKKILFSTLTSLYHTQKQLNILLSYLNSIYKKAINNRDKKF